MGANRPIYEWGSEKGGGANRRYRPIYEWGS